MHGLRFYLGGPLAEETGKDSSHSTEIAKLKVDNPLFTAFRFYQGLGVGDRRK